MHNLEKKVARTLRIKPEIVENAQMPETRLGKIYNTCSKAMFPKKLPFALSMTTMLCSIPAVMWIDEKALVPFIASVLALPWATLRAQEFENRKENIANQIAKKANTHGHSYPVKGRLLTDFSQVANFKKFLETAKDFGKDVKETFRSKNIKSTMSFLVPYLIATPLVFGLVATNVIIQNNAEDQVDDVRVQLDSLRYDRRYFSLLGPGFLHSEIHGKMEYKNDKGDDCTFKIERPLNFWGNKQIAPDKTSNKCTPAPWR